MSTSTSAARPQSRSRTRSRTDLREEGTGAGAASGSSSSISDGRLPDEGGDELDFCNAFWTNRSEVLSAQDGKGMGSSGPLGQPSYDTLMTRNKNSGRMLEDFRAFFKERAAIEEDYAKRMAKLARMPLGRDENGELGNLLKRLQYELDMSGKCHGELANVIRQTLETRVRDYEASRDQRRKNVQSNIERSWKNKLAQEASVHKAMEKYKQDCILINSFSARLSLTQGKDLDRVTAKLDKAQQTVQVNEAEYKNFCRALKDTHHKWVEDWRSWCDLSQDLEEERIDFTRNSLWAYVNAVSLVCVKDDEACENVRQSVENCDATRELRTWVAKEKGGNIVPDPPHFNDFSDGDKGFAQPPMQEAKFARLSRKADQAPFDSLERLQAAIYPQSQRDGAKGRAQPQTPQATGSTAAGYDTARQSPGTAEDVRAATPRSHTPPASTARTSSPTKPSAVTSPKSSQPKLPAMFSATDAKSGGSKSRPTSRVGTYGELDKPESEMTTAERLQYQASQKRISTTAKTTMPAPPSPNYPYASPRHAKPFDPASAAESDIVESSEAILPAVPPVPTAKKGEDPLLAALAKLRSPGSAVDVLPANSPGVPSLPGTSGTFGRSGGSFSQNQIRSHTPNLAQPGQAQFDGRRSPSQPIPNQNARSGAPGGYARPPSTAGQYGDQVQAGMSRSATSPAPHTLHQNSISYNRPLTDERGPPRSASSVPYQQQQQARSRPTTPVAGSYPAGQYGAPHGGQIAPQGRAPNGFPAQGQPYEKRQSIGQPSNAAPPPASLVQSHSRPASPAMRSPPSQNAYAGYQQQPNMSQGYQNMQQGGPPGMRSPSPGPGYGQPIPGTAIPSQGSMYVAGDRPHSYHPQQPPVGGRVPAQQPRPVSYGATPTNPQIPQQQQRPTTPLGIALDATGAVTQDQMANRYASPAPMQQQQSQQQAFGVHSQGRQSTGPSQPPVASGVPLQSSASQPQSLGYKHGAAMFRQGQPGQPSLQQGQQPLQGRNSFSTPVGSQIPGGMQGAFSPGPGQQGMMQQSFSAGMPRQQQPSSQQPQPYNTGYRPPSTHQQMPMQHQHITPQQPAQQQSIGRSGSMGVPPAQVDAYSMPAQPAYTDQPFQSNPQMVTSPSAGVGPAPPAPAQPNGQQRSGTGQFTESGFPIKFYVRAIYQYDASTPEEFSFQKDDVICVLQTAEDGWWEGELLDPVRAKAAGNARTFPSNFTTLLE